MWRGNWQSKLLANRKRGDHRAGLLAIEYAMFGCLAILVVLTLIVAFAPFLP